MSVNKNNLNNMRIINQINKSSSIQNYINHIVFVVDNSGSMISLKSQTIKVFDEQIKNLVERSKSLNQPTRVSVYLFGDKVNCIFYDTDVEKIPSLNGYYTANGNSTALLDGTIKALTDLSETSQRYGDHAFLVYVLTDGENNVNNHLIPELSRKITELPDNWTVAVFVPNQHGVFAAKQFGFPANNISVWNTNEKGMEEVGHTMNAATTSYYVGRSSGIRSTKSLFSLDTSALSKNVVKNLLEELPASEYEVLLVRTKSVIKPFVESWTKQPYRVGSAYYQLTKPEVIQLSKNICIQEKRNGKVYSGNNARKLLNLPDYEVKVNPVDFGDYNIFVQSTSVNRYLMPDTQLIILK